MAEGSAGVEMVPRAFLDLLTLRFLLFYGTRPAHVFGSLGLASVGVGLATGLYLLSFVKLVLGQSIGNRPLLTLSVLLLIIGVQMIAMGFLGELTIRMCHEAQGKPIYFIREVLNGPQMGRSWAPTHRRP